MTDAPQIEQDLHFVRQAVERRNRAQRGPFAIYYVWAIYVLVGYTMLDHDTRVASWFFMIGGIAGGVLSAILGARYARATGELDRTDARRSGWHFGGGVLLAMAASIALAIVVPALRGQAAAQVLVVLIGLDYFLAGLHFDRNFLWLGPIVMAGGIFVGSLGWTWLGVIIALGLVVPTFFPPHQRQAAA